jgi:hypothetical protein
MPRSQNGYVANDITLTEVRVIPGTSRSIRLRKGSCGWMLRDFAAWFDKNIESIDNDGELDDWGYAERPIRGGEELSNHASGTAMDLNAPEHPLGVRGTFTPAQTEKIRARLRLYQGCIRWGGDYVNRADEMHFEIVQPQGTVAAVSDQIKADREALRLKIRHTEVALDAAKADVKHLTERLATLRDQLT